MTAKTKNKAATETIVVTRVINAPCEKVFRAWTEPKQMAQWFSPDDIECREVKASVKVGGAFRIHMVSKKGDHFAIGKYKEIVKNELLRMTWEWEAFRMPESILTVAFEDLGETTRITLTHEGLPDKGEAKDHTEGWTSALKKFARLMKQNKIQ
jgi:uncharacterized protein YndB with AHSA1/START domain